LGETVKINAIVLNKVDYKENDRIVTLLSGERGKLTASVKGVKKPTAKLRPSSELFAFGTYILAESHGRYTVTGYDSIEPFHELREDFDRLAYASLLLKIAGGVCEEDREEAEMLALLLKSLDKIREGNVSPAFVSSLFILKLCEISGYKPITDCCAVCGEKEDIIALSPECGGMVCKSCLSGEHIAISGGCAFYIKKIISERFEDCFTLKPNEKQEKELYKASCYYISYFLDERLKIAEYIAKYNI